VNNYSTDDFINTLYQYCLENTEQWRAQNNSRVYFLDLIMCSIFVNKKVPALTPWQTKKKGGFCSQSLTAGRAENEPWLHI